MGFVTSTRTSWCTRARTPRRSSSIEGTVKNTSEYELLAGPVRVFMDDGFATKTSLNVNYRHSHAATATW